MMTNKQEECLHTDWETEVDNGWKEALATGLFDHVIYTHSRICKKCGKEEFEARGECVCSLCCTVAYPNGTVLAEKKEE